jgi:hypothetical protein
VDARAMVFDIGDLITGWGRVVVDSEGEWLDLAHVVTLPWFGRPRPRSRYSVRLVGVDLSAVPTEFGPGSVIPDHITVIGAWRDGVIEVASQSPDRPPSRVDPDRSTPPCPPPPGGWPIGPKDENLDFNVKDLVSSGLAVTVAIFRPSSVQAVLVVAASDIEAVESVLRPQLKDRLCVVASRWSRRYLDEIHAHLLDRMLDWTIDWLSPTIDGQGQAGFTARLMRVTPEIADWAQDIEADVLTLEPALLPASFREPIRRSG